MRCRFINSKNLIKRQNASETIIKFYSSALKNHFYWLKDSLKILVPTKVLFDRDIFFYSLFKSVISNQNTMQPISYVQSKELIYELN